MINYIRTQFKILNKQKYNKNLIESLLRNLEEQEVKIKSSKNTLRNTEDLDTVLQHVKFLMEDDVYSNGIEIAGILKRINKIYDIDIMSVFR